MLASHCVEACCRSSLCLLPRDAEDANSEAMEQLRRLHDEYEAYISHAKQTGAACNAALSLCCFTMRRLALQSFLVCCVVLSPSHLCDNSYNHRTPLHCAPEWLTCPEDEQSEVVGVPRQSQRWRHRWLSSSGRLRRWRSACRQRA